MGVCARAGPSAADHSAAEVPGQDKCRVGAESALDYAHFAALGVRIDDPDRTRPISLLKLERR